MSSQIEFTLEAETRQDVGKGASRRLRRQKRVPAVVYGGSDTAVAVTLSHDEVYRKFQHEAFFSHIITLKLDGKKKQQAIMRDVQRHPFKPLISHIDFQRIVADQEIQVRVPLHFANVEECPGVRMNGGEMSHLENDVLVACLPKDLPEYIEVDVVNMDIGDTIHLSELVMPEGTRALDLDHGEDYDRGVISCHMPRVTTEEDLEVETEEGEELEAVEGEELAEGEEGADEGEEGASESGDEESKGEE